MQDESALQTWIFFIISNFNNKSNLFRVLYHDNKLVGSKLLYRPKCVIFIFLYILIGRFSSLRFICLMRSDSSRRSENNLNMVSDSISEQICR